MDDPAASLAAARYARMRWNTPLSEHHATLLLDRLDLAEARSVLDLGCGWGELLLRAVEEAGNGVAGTGVDTSESALLRAQASAEARGLGHLVRFVNQSAAGWTSPAERVLCIGTSHAWGGTRQALRSLTTVVPPGGRLLFGDACWERPPTDSAQAMFGTEAIALPEIITFARASGWRVLHLSTADQREWDDFESTWRAGRHEWLRGHPDDPESLAVRQELDTQLDDYVSIYRGVLSFCYLVLGRWT